MNLSVIIPACNEERTIERTLRSVAAQTAPGDEIIVCDDASTDGTGRVARTSLEGVETSTTVLSNQTNQGIVPTLNRCLKIATNPGLVRVDADTELGPGVISAIRGELEDGADLVWPKVVPDNTESLHPSAALLGKRRGNGRWFGGACVGVRRDLLEKTGGFGVARDPGAAKRGDEMEDLRARAQAHGWTQRKRPDVSVYSEFPTSPVSIVRRKYYSSKTHAERIRDGPSVRDIIELRGPLFWTAVTVGLWAVLVFPPVAFIAALLGLTRVLTYWHESRDVVETTGARWHRPAYVGYRVVGGLARTVGAWEAFLRRGRQ